MTWASLGEGLSCEALPTRQGIHLSPLPCLPNWPVQMASAPGPQRPWEGVGEAGELGFLGP